jgi:hypothetical protein
MPSAKADYTLFQESSLDGNIPSASPDFDLVSLEVWTDPNYPNSIAFWLNFSQPVSPSKFVYSSIRNPWASLMFYYQQPTSLSMTFDYLVRTNSSLSFTGSNSISAPTYKLTNGVYSSELTNCTNRVWNQVTSNSIGFTVDKNCINLPDKFWVVGFTDADGNGATSTLDYDYAPENAMLVNLNASSTTSSKLPQNIYIDEYPETQDLRKTSTINLSASSDSSLPIRMSSETPAICGTYFFPTVYLLNVGTCRIRLFINEDLKYRAAQDQYLDFEIISSKATPTTTKKATPTTTKKATPTTTKKATPTITKKATPTTTKKATPTTSSIKGKTKT